MRNKLIVPRTIRMMVKDLKAAQASARKILQWPLEGIVLAHNAVIEVIAHSALKKAFDHFE